MKNQKLSKYVSAKIFWIDSKNGGKKTNLPKNTKYAPIIIFENAEEVYTWSVLILIIKNFKEYSLAKLTYLSDEADFNNLKKGNKFKLYEGPNFVANGEIIIEK